MSKNNIFTEDIEIPPIVLKKADSAFLNIKTERNCGMRDKKKSNKRMIRRMAAVAACAAAVIVASGPLGGVLEKAGKDSGAAEEYDMFHAAADQFDKMFTLSVHAEESGGQETKLLTEERPVPVAVHDNKSGSWIFGGDEESGTVNYCIQLPQILCKGEKIKSVTYSVNNGAIQIVQPQNEKSIVIDGDLYDKELNTGSIGGDHNEMRNGEPSRPFETLLYRSYTVDYEKQTDENTWISICNELADSQDVIQLIWKEDGTNADYSKGVQKMLGDTVITCTVNYEDGTSQSADIKVGSCVMTREEAGEALPEEVSPDELKEETTVITFELQK